MASINQSIISGKDGLSLTVLPNTSWEVFFVKLFITSSAITKLAMRNFVIAYVVLCNEFSFNELNNTFTKLKANHVKTNFALRKPNVCYCYFHFPRFHWNKSSIPVPEYFFGLVFFCKIGWHNEIQLNTEVYLGVLWNFRIEIFENRLRCNFK
jgi:hypothetical protein